MRKWHGIVLIVLTFLAVWCGQAGSAAAGEGDKLAPAPFRDLDKHWAKAVIEEAAAKGIVSGFPDGTFRPNDSVTVAQFLRMLFTSMAEKDNSGKLYWSQKQLALVPEWFQQIVRDSAISFEPGNPWYAPYVEDAKFLGVINRNEYAGRYNEALTRERAAVMIDELDKYFHGVVTDGYADVAGPQLFKDYHRGEDTYFRRAMAKVAIRGIMVGNNGYFNPKAAITRAEAVQIVSVLADASKRAKVSINMNGVPYSVVKNPGYGDMVFVFANPEMKKCHDSLVSSLSSYPGSTEAYVGTIGYYENDTNKEKALYQEYYVDLSDQKHYMDMGISFASTNYNLALSTLEGRSERAYKPLTEFLAMLFKNPEPVKKLMIGEVAADRDGKSATVQKTFEGRDVLIAVNGYRYLQISIGAYGDK